METVVVKLSCWEGDASTCVIAKVSLRDCSKQ
jgi:hypothetical protein